MSHSDDVDEASCNDVVNCAIFVASLAALLALAAAARPSNVGQLSSLSRAALPVLYICAEVFELWSEFFERSIFVHGLEDVLECHGWNEGHLPVLMGWLLPHAVVMALLLLAIARGLLALLARATMRQLTEALDHEEAPGTMAKAVAAALSDTLTAAAVLFSAVHVFIARVTLRGLQTGDLAFWCPATLLMATLNIASPVGALAWIVRWARSHQQGARRAAVVAPPKSDARTEALCAVSSLVNSEPWAIWQLIGNLLAVTGLESSRAAGQDSVGLAWAQCLVFCELLLLLWPRWLADVRLLRFNALMRAALLTATRLQQVTGLKAACAWSAAAALCGAVALAMAVGASLAAGWTATGLPSLLHVRKRTVAPESPDPQAAFVRDLSQGLLFVALSEPEQVAELCKGLSADESLCLRNASELVLRRLRSAADAAGGAAAEPGGTNSPERRGWNEKSNTSHHTMWSEAASGSRDWVAPLPLLGTDDETFTGQRRSIDRKWLLDHFVPASSGPSPVVSPRPSNSSRSTKHSLHRSKSNELDRRQHVLLRSRSSDAKSQSYEDRRRLLRSRSSDAKSYSYEDGTGLGAKLELPDLRPAARTINCLMPPEATSIMPKARSDGTEPIAFTRGLSWDSICSGGSHEAPCSSNFETGSGGGGRLTVPSEDAWGWASENSGSSLTTSDLWQVAIRSYSQDLSPRDKGEITLPDIQRNLEFLKAENLRLRRETEQMQGAAREWSGKRPSYEDRPTVSSHLVSRQLPPEMPPEMPPEASPSLPPELPPELPNVVGEMLVLPSELPSRADGTQRTWEVLPIEETAKEARNLQEVSTQEFSSTQEACSSTQEASSSHGPRVPSGSDLEEAVKTQGAGEANAPGLSEQEQWEKWRARKEARKAKAGGKLKYGEWLKNMAGDG